MGIPSYFSYIIKNHANIVRQFANVGHIHHLYMDCNSIIYDLFHATDGVIDEDVLVRGILDKIHHYVRYIQPSKTLFVAFDGVAPLAKMEQQRTRRHKTLWSAGAENTWSTSNITPGTRFMTKLSAALDREVFLAPTVHVSSSEKPGEGEHKLFQHIRGMQPTQDTAVVYGLDSDLIMLSLFHCHYFKHLFVFRETPEFLKNQIACHPTDPCHFLDIGHLSSAILREMVGLKARNPNIYDYVFMCFFLGNDFLPHFPSLNLRTHGLDVLLRAYRKTGVTLIVNETIQWKQVHVFLRELARQEHELWMQEYEVRHKWSNRNWSSTSRDNVLQNVPVIYRAEELYIAPDQAGWESRYYRALFHHGARRQDVCKNYVEGLAWVFEYYTRGCVHWQFRYKHMYPPLLRDLVDFVHVGSGHDARQTILKPHEPFSADQQLAYVIPKSLHAQVLGVGNEKSATTNVSFQWAFCRYFWEAHVVLEEDKSEIVF